MIWAKNNVGRYSFSGALGGLGWILKNIFQTEIPNKPLNAPNVMDPILLG